jgi:hypothetical protein
LIIVSAIERNLCAFARDGFSQRRKRKAKDSIPSAGRFDWRRVVKIAGCRVNGNGIDSLKYFSEGESSELFTKEDIQEFSAELSKIPPPADAELKREYDNLKKLLGLALGNSDFKLVLSSS